MHQRCLCETFWVIYCGEQHSRYSGHSRQHTANSSVSVVIAAIDSELLFGVPSEHGLNPPPNRGILGRPMKSQVLGRSCLGCSSKGRWKGNQACIDSFFLWKLHSIVFVSCEWHLFDLSCTCLLASLQQDLKSESLHVYIRMLHVWSMWSCLMSYTYDACNFRSWGKHVILPHAACMLDPCTFASWVTYIWSMKCCLIHKELLKFHKSRCNKFLSDSETEYECHKGKEFVDLPNIEVSVSFVSYMSVIRVGIV